MPRKLFILPVQLPVQEGYTAYTAVQIGCTIRTI